ncbi:MAG: forkhead-associated protein, partial [Methylobacter sp.]
ALEESDSILVNNQPIHDALLKLNNNDVIVVDNTSLQFFLDTHP